MAKAADGRVEEGAGPQVELDSNEEVDYRLETYRAISIHI